MCIRKEKCVYERKNVNKKGKMYVRKDINVCKKGKMCIRKEKCE